MLNGLLPIGTIVLLNDMDTKVMITGVCQRGVNNPEEIWDYVGVIYPQGYLDADTMFLFNNEQIVQLYHLGYRTEEQMEFAEMAFEALQHARAEQ